MEYAVNLLEHLYRTMVRIRYCEESLVDPILNKEVVCPCHLYSGEEAVAAGICASLSDRDYVFGTHRSHGHFLAKGGSMREMIAEIYGRATGCSRGRGGSMHLIDTEKGILGAAPIVAGTISLALGAALSSFIREDDRVTVSFFGDGASGEGVLYESMNFASLKKLPIVFVCENNLYSTHLPIGECRVESNIYKVAEPFCVAGFQVDGNDVLQVHAIGKAAVERCRRGEGPVFIECLTYRFRGHVGPNDNIQGQQVDIRPPEEIAAWLEKDPIPRLENYLLTNRLMDARALQSIREQAHLEVADAHAFAIGSPLPGKEELLQHVYK